MSNSKMTETLMGRFGVPDESYFHRTIARITGEVGTGKTRFALTAPGPHVYQSLDKGLEGTIQQARREGLVPDQFHEIQYAWHRPGTNERLTQAYAIELRDKFIEDYRFALTHGARVITWDKESEVWELFRYAAFGIPNADKPKDYIKLNADYEALIDEAKDFDVNLFLIQGMRTPWGMVNGKFTRKNGQREAEGFEKVDALVYVEMHFRREREIDEDNPEGITNYYIDIGKCRQNSALQDTTIPAMGFEDFGTLLIPGSKAGDWK